MTRPPPPRDPRRRAVVTGLGAITPIGNDVATYWANLTAGVSGVGPITAYDASAEDVRIAAEVKDFDPKAYMDFKQARRMSRFSQLAVAAARQAIDDAGLEIGDHNRDDVAVVMNTGGGGMVDVADGHETYLTKGPARVSPFMVPMLSPSMAACQISIQNGIRGPVITSVAACASGVQAFVEAQRLIEHGDVDVVVAGGTESAILPVAFAALANMGALSKRNDDPEGASRPFDANRDGFVFGEAAGVLVVEAAEHAEARGAEIIGEIAGGTESAIMPVAFAALANMGALSKRNDDPTRASRPFDGERDGFVFGEAAGVLVVESAEHAESRGAAILAEVAGGALTGDAFHISAPEPSGYGASLAMERAIRDAHLELERVDLVVAHGTSTPLNDATETKAIRAAFGAHADRLAVTSNKSMLGHTLGAAGAMSALAAVLAIRDGRIPPTINQDTPDPACDLDYVPNTCRHATVDTAIINGFGFGGQNAVSVFTRFAG